MTEQEMEAVLDPALYIGRCPEQVERLVKKLQPILSGVTAQTIEINV